MIPARDAEARLQCQYEHYELGLCQPATCLTLRCTTTEDDWRCAWQSQCISEFL